MDIFSNDIQIFTGSNKIKLYHGSSGKLEGKFRHNHPKAYSRSDFGLGGYLGTNLNQVQKYVYDKANPHISEFLLDLSGLSCIRLDGVAWALTVLANRGKLDEHPVLEQYFKELIDTYDVVIGPIADDNMFVALILFFTNGLSDVGLVESLQLCNLGDQYVIKSQEATERCHLVNEKPLDTKIINTLREQRKNSGGNRKSRDYELAQMVRAIAGRTRKLGNTLDEIINVFDEKNMYHQFKQ